MFGISNAILKCEICPEKKDKCPFDRDNDEDEFLQRTLLSQWALIAPSFRMKPGVGWPATVPRKAWIRGQGTEDEWKAGVKEASGSKEEKGRPPIYSGGGLGVEVKKIEVFTVVAMLPRELRWVDASRKGFGFALRFSSWRGHLPYDTDIALG